MSEQFGKYSNEIIPSSSFFRSQFSLDFIRNLTLQERDKEDSPNKLGKTKPGKLRRKIRAEFVFEKQKKMERMRKDSDSANIKTSFLFQDAMVAKGCKVETKTFPTIRRTKKKLLLFSLSKFGYK